MLRGSSPGSSADKSDGQKGLLPLMKTVLLSKDLPAYKANLHCHTIYSDGKLTPAEVKERYQAKGYSIVAYSDHNVLVDHAELNGPDFLALPAIEMDVYRSDPVFAFRPCYHVNFFPRRSGQTAIPCFNPDHIRHGNLQEELRVRQAHIGGSDYVRVYENVQEIIDAYRDAGFLAMINHPTWSLQTAADYRDLHGFFAIELYNNGSAVKDGYYEFNTAIWDELLRSGMRVFGTATDDNHNQKPFGDPKDDSCGGFTVIQADSLTQEAVTDALGTGRFYASTGPLFRSIVLEDDILKVECSPVRKVLLTTGHRQASVVRPASGMETVTSAEFDLHHILSDSYVRLTLVDAKGRFAWSQPIYNYIGRKE